MDRECSMNWKSLATINHQLQGGGGGGGEGTQGGFNIKNY